MEARSYIENIANRTTMRGVIATMTRVLLVVTILAAFALAIGSGFHPAATIVAVVLLGLAAVLSRDVVLVTRDLRASPLDLAFDPAPRGGRLSPGTVFGIAGGVGLFGVVLGIVTWFSNPSQGLVWAGIGLALAAAVAAMGLPTLGVQGRKWQVLADALRDHPELVDYLQDARARFPKSAPFPFQAPTDVVSIP